MGIRLTKAELKKLGIKLPAKNKYNAKPTVVDGVRFASKKEARRYGQLKLMQKAGEIECLRLQVSYDLHAFGGKLIGKYVADFVYHAGGRVVVEDVKGGRATALAMYRWKKRHMLAEYGIAIKEV